MVIIILILDKQTNFQITLFVLRYNSFLLFLKFSANFSSKKRSRFYKKDLDSAATIKLEIKRGTVNHEVKMINIDEKNKVKNDCIWTNLLERSNNLKTPLRVYCKIKAMFQAKSFKMGKSVTLNQMTEAFQLFIKITQTQMKMVKMRTKQLATLRKWNNLCRNEIYIRVDDTNIWKGQTSSDTWKI